MMRTTKTKYAAGLPAALRTISILFSDQQRSHNLHFLRTAASDFDAFVCFDELVCRAALFLPFTRLVVADILFLLRHNLGVVVEEYVDLVVSQDDLVCLVLVDLVIHIANLL